MPQPDPTNGASRYHVSQELTVDRDGRCLTVSRVDRWPLGYAYGFGLLHDGSYRFWLPRRIVLARWPFQAKKWREDRKRLARLRALYWILVRNYETELCERCGRPVGIVYHAPDGLWELATGHARFPDGQSALGVLCPKCLDDLVDQQIDGYLTWTCEIANTSEEVDEGEEWARRRGPIVPDPSVDWSQWRFE